ncbi:MAG: AI-2E family transporter [Pseudomonadota bacterium]|nr:AI-2E family transporter [Pseudomonadota bacterium]
MSLPSSAEPATPTPASGYATSVLAVLAVIVALWWGQSFMIPLTAGLMLALLVQPVTALLTRWLRVRMLAAALTLALVITAIGLAGAAFGDQLGRVASRAPDMINLVAQQVSATNPGADSVLQRAREAFRQLDLAADRLAGVKPLLQTPRSRAAAARQADAAASAAAAATPTLSQTATVALRESAVSGSSALLKLAGDLTILCFVAFFVLTGGPLLAERFLNLWGARPDLRERAEHAALECVRQIRIYGAVLLVTNSIVGLAVWAAFAVSGLPDAGGWGITAAVLHVVPYLGMALLTGLGAAEAFLAHGTLSSALGMAAFLLLLSSLIGTLVTAWLQGRAAKMNAAAVFIGVVFWGALWGVWGLLLGPALIVLIKVVAEHTRPGQRFANLMQG